MSPERIPDLIAQDLDIWSIRDGVAEVRVSRDELAGLEAAGWECSVVCEDVYAAIDQVESATAPSGEPWTSYHSLASAEALLTDLHNSHPDISALETIGLSVEGRGILALRISDDAAVVDHDEPATLFIGCHHAREWISVEVPLYLAEYLLTHYENDPEIRRFVDRSEIWIVPVVNPDGFLYSHTTNRWWRKNRRNNGDGTFGVDVNRNYSYEWGGIGSSGQTGSESYRGPAPFSEPETRAVRDLFPDDGGRSFAALITYHNYSQLVLYPWGYTYSPPPDVVLLSGLAYAMRDLINDAHSDPQYDYVAQQSSDLYFTNGDTTDWAYGVYGIPAFTIEVRPATSNPGFALPPAQILPTCQENLAAALYLIDWAIGEPPGDFDSDGDVDEEDFVVFRAAFGHRQGEPDYNPDADFDGDGDVDCDDGAVFLESWTGPPAEPPTLPECEDAPEIALWEIRADHGGGDIFTAITDGWVEPRTCGIARLRVCFDQEMDTSVTDPNEVTIVGGAGGPQSAPCSITWESDQCLLIELCSALPDQDTYTVTMGTGLRSVFGVALDGDRDIALAALAGDVTADRLVDNSDMIEVRTRRGQPVTGTNCRDDVNCDGIIDNSDLIAVRVRRGNAVAAP